MNRYHYLGILLITAGTFSTLVTGDKSALWHIFGVLGIGLGSYATIFASRMVQNKDNNNMNLLLNNKVQEVIAKIEEAKELPNPEARCEELDKVESELLEWANMLNQDPNSIKLKRDEENAEINKKQVELSNQSRDKYIAVISTGGPACSQAGCIIISSTLSGSQEFGGIVPPASPVATEIQPR